MATTEPSLLLRASTGAEAATVECTPVKTEKKDCVLCLTHNSDVWFDMLWTETTINRTSLISYICRVADIKLAHDSTTEGLSVCNSCFDLVNVLERAEMEYIRVKETFITLITSSSYFESNASEVDTKHGLEIIKQESSSEYNNDVGSLLQSRDRKDSDDEPLAVRKRRGRKPGKKKKEGKIEKVTIVVVKEENNIHGPCQSLTPIPEEKTEDNIDWDDGVDFSDNDYEPLTKIKTLKKSRPKEKNLRKNITTEEKDSDLCVFNNTTSVKDEQVDKSETKQAQRRERIKKQSKVYHTCTECKARFSSLSRLTAHQAKHEAGKAPFICEICGASYKHKKACDTHVALHKGISDWKCEECNKLFPSKGALRRHNAIHTGKTNYQCDLCGKSFIHTSSFKMHKLSHSGLKPHKCDVCGLALMTRSHLKRHARIHSGEKRHECTLCGKRFSERYNLLVHQKSHDDALPKLGRKEGVTWRGFRCHFCDKRFERRYMLEKHMEVEHERIMEKGPPRPRNTMAKLLKAQAAAVGMETAKQSTPANRRSEQATQIDTTMLQDLLLKDGDSASQKTAAEENSVDIKPSIESRSEEKTKVCKEHKNSSSSAATTRSGSIGENYEVVRITNGSWSSGQCASVEFI